MLIVSCHKLEVKSSSSPLSEIATHLWYLVDVKYWKLVSKSLLFLWLVIHELRWLIFISRVSNSIVISQQLEMKDNNAYFVVEPSGYTQATMHAQNGGSCRENVSTIHLSNISSLSFLRISFCLRSFKVLTCHLFPTTMTPLQHSKLFKEYL